MNPVIETRFPSRFPKSPLFLTGVALLGLCFAGALPAQVAKKPSSAKAARAALVAAGKLTKTPKGASKKARLVANARAVEAFAELENRYATQESIVAQARFRRAKILGRMGQEEQALRAYRGALTADAAGIGARSMLEAGHLERRLKRYSEALGFYRESAELLPAKPARRASGKTTGKTTGKIKSKKPAPNQRYASEARIWIGVTLAKLGRVPDARRCWTTLAAESMQEPKLRVKAFDRLAMSYLADKNEDDAKKVLADADQSLAAACEGNSKTAQSLQRSLSRMRARKALAKAQTARQEREGKRSSNEKSGGAGNKSGTSASE